MFNLTIKAANNFKYSWKNLPMQDGDYWRIDICHINRLKYLMAVHEETFCTHLLRAFDFKSFELIHRFILELSPWFCFSSVSIGKCNDRKVTGTMTEMKKIIWSLQDEYTPLQIEKLLNQTPWFALKSHWVKDEIERYRKDHL